MWADPFTPAAYLNEHPSEKEHHMYIEQIFNRTGVSTGLPKRGIAAIMLAAGMAVVSPAAAQSQGYGERAEREQRYDPTDWEDDNWEGEEPWDDGDWDDEEWTDRDWSDNDWNTAYEVYGEDDIGDDYWGEDRWYNEDWHHDDWYAADPYYDAWDYYYDFDGYDDDYHYYRDYRDDWGSRDDDEYYWRDDDWGVEYDGWDERDRYEDRDWQYERWSSDRGDLHRQVQIRGELEGWSPNF